MNWKRLTLICIVILVAVSLFVPVVDAKSKGKGKGKSKSKGKSSKGTKRYFQDQLVLVGADLGPNVFGAVPFGTITLNKGLEDEEEVNFNGIGGLGFYGGINGHLHFEGWIVRGEFVYSQQDGTFSFEDKNDDNKEIEHNFRLNNIKFGVGFGKSLVKHRIIHPYLLGVLDYHYLDFRNTDQEDEKAKGSGLGIGGILGLDAKIPKMNGLVAGAGARLDLIYTVNPLKIGDNEITMGYMPITIFLKGGWLFM